MSKEDLYIALTQMYNWTPDQIANLNPYQQLIYLRGPTVQTMSHEEFLAFQASRKK